MVDTPAAKACLSDNESAATRTKQILFGDTDIGVPDIGMCPLIFSLGMVGETDISDDLDPRGVGRYQQHRLLLVGRVVRFGNHHHDQKTGEPGVG